MYFAIQSAVGGYVWQIRRRGNNEILASSEILRERSTCLEAMRLVRAEAGVQRSYWDRASRQWVTF
jgi:uncharacterized protein YegP (UPF0339 family)